jgi:uncharacterized protein (DUF305 family)
MRILFLALTFVLVVIFAFSAPTGAATTAKTKAAPKPVVQPPANPTVAMLSKLSGKDFDVAYARELIPVHEEAIEIAYAATLNANHPELLQWNQRMIDRKGDQTRKMLALLQEMGTTPTKRNASVVTDRVKKIRGLGGEALEKAYMPMMIDHFGQSVAISRLAMTKASNQSLKDVAGAVVRIETQETEMLRAWLKTWYKM